MTRVYVNPGGVFDMQTGLFPRDAVAPQETDQDDGNQQDAQEENAGGIRRGRVGYGCWRGGYEILCCACDGQRHGYGCGCGSQCGGENKNVPHQEGNSQEYKEEDDGVPGDVGGSHALISISCHAGAFGIMGMQPKPIPGDK